MLTQIINDFLSYFDNVDFKERSLDSASLRLKQFDEFCQTKNINQIKDITYADLLTFITEFGYCSIHVKKSRVWALHQFFHFLTLKQIIKQNIAASKTFARTQAAPSTVKYLRSEAIPNSCNWQMSSMPISCHFTIY